MNLRELAQELEALAAAFNRDDVVCDFQATDGGDPERHLMARLQRALLNDQSELEQRARAAHAGESARPWDFMTVASGRYAIWANTLWKALERVEAEAASGNALSSDSLALLRRTMNAIAAFSTAQQRLEKVADSLRRGDGVTTEHAYLRDRFLGCLLGGAVGDALGYPLEFVRDAAAFDLSPPPTLRVASDGLAVVSDDTQMTLFCAEGVIRSIARMHDRGLGSPDRVLEYAFDRWLTTQVGKHVPTRWGELSGWLVQEPRLHARRAPGRTCLAALEALRSGKDVVNTSKGCGAVMRSAPIGLAAVDAKSAFELARDSGRSTHQHPSGFLSAAAFAAIIHSCSRGKRLQHAVDEALLLLAAESAHDETSEALRAASAAAEQPLSRALVESLGEGWTGEEALAIGVLCALHGAQEPARVSEALWRSVAHRGDSDSTGSITGNLLGAVLGMQGVPSGWLAQIELRGVVDRIATDLYAVAVEGTEPDAEAYPPY